MKGFQFRPSRVLKKIRSGGVASCVKLNLADPRVAEIAARCGFDCVWLDMEHVPNTLHDIENQIRAAKMHDVDSMVRVRRGSYSDHILPFEMDAAGIMVPHVMNLADAKQIIRNTRFHPIGRRPIDRGDSDGGYCMIPHKEYVQKSNEERFIVLQIEDPEPLDELEEIAQIDGFDMLFFGRNDFSHAIGIPGEFDDPRIIEARDRVVRIARKYGKFSATVGSVENYAELVKMGYQFISVGADVVSLTQSFTSLTAAISEMSS